MASDRFDRVNGLPLRLVISAGQDLGHQPQAQELNTCQYQHSSGKQERPVFQHDFLVEDELLKDQGGTDQTAGPRCQETEEVQRPCRIIEQELCAHEIEDDMERSQKPIVRVAGPTRWIVDRDFRNPCSRPSGQSGDETVEVAIELNILNDLSPISLESLS